MARKTKAQLENEELEYRIKLERELYEMYPSRLVGMLERATNLGYELVVKNSLFQVTNHGTYDTWIMPLTYSEEGQDSLNCLTWVVESGEKDREEAEIKTKARLTALNKLTKEERLLLGL